MSSLHGPEEFLRLINPGTLLVDVRSEKEYLHAHIPGAVNIPLLNNEHRHEVGIMYKQKGREAAVELGFRLAGPLFADMIAAVKSQAPGRELLVYCWRGGMRSGIFSWMLSLAGFRVSLLKGGYKRFRAYVLSTFDADRQFIVVGGKTGSGKTEILNHLSAAGEQVIDFEALANHKGSAFGALGQEEQPSNEHFENLIALQLSSIDNSTPVWVEGESRSIGRVKIPDPLFDRIGVAPLIEIDMDVERRTARIREEYGSFPEEQLAECTGRIRKRLGDLRTRQAIELLRNGQMEEWIAMMLEYYDKTYAYSLKARTPSVHETVSIGKESLQDVAGKLIAKKDKLGRTLIVD